MTWVSAQVTSSSTLSRGRVRSAGAVAAVAASAPPIQSRYCGDSVLFGTISRQAAATDSNPTTAIDAGPACQARQQRETSSSTQPPAATADSVSSVPAPGPSTWKAKNRVYGVDQVAESKQRANSSGTAQIVSSCSPRSLCQVSGDSSRAVPPAARVATTASTPNA